MIISSIISSHQLRNISIFVALLAMLLATLATPNSDSHAQPPTGADQVMIQATDGVAQELFGDPAVISGDLLAVSSIFADINGLAAGAVYLYERDPQAPGGWAAIHKLQRDPPYHLGQFGQTLALQGDTLVVGAPRDPRINGFWQGGVSVYERNQGGPDAWGLVARLADETDEDMRQFGSAVAIDGDLVAVGVRGADNNQGKVYLYSRTAGWARIKTISDPAGQSGDQFGTAIALAGDTLVVGAAFFDADPATTSSGAAFVYERNQGGAEQWGLVTRLEPEIASDRAFFGNDLALDGATLVVTAVNANRYENGQIVGDEAGAAYLYERNQGGANAWGLTATLHPPDGRTREKYGASLALSGNELWIGAPESAIGGFSDQGVVYHYQRGAGGANNWDLLPLIAADNGSLRDEFGSSLAFDGGTLVTGAPGRSALQGAVYLIDRVNAATPNAYSVFLPLVAREWVAPTGILVDGGTLESPAGAIIGAVPGTLSAPIDATIEVTARPPTALPGGFVPRGDYYLLQARILTLTPADKPLLVGLPVPEGANPGRLAVAAYIPGGWTSEQESSENPARSWTTLPGSYDPANELFVVTVRALVPEGVTLVLFEHPANEPLPQATAQAQVQQAPVEYEVACDPATPSTAACDPGYYLLVGDELEQAHDEFVNTHGFNAPALVHLAGTFVGPDRQPQLNETYYGAVVSTAPCITPTGQAINGEYNWMTLRLLVCVDPLGSTDALRRAVRHELFHAIQAAYPRVADDFVQTEVRPLTYWLLEGTATAAERSGFLMLRSPRAGLRQVTAPLTSTLGLHEYATQDFWVFTGLEGSQSDRYISYLHPVFEAGATPEHVNQAIPLGDAYWSWVKNQVIEHYQPMIDAFATGPCQLDDQAVDPDTLKLISYPNQFLADGTLPPLTSALVEVQVGIARAQLPIRVANNTVSSYLRYKVYMQDEAGCRVVDDGTRNLSNVPANSRIYVLVSNIDLYREFDYVVEID